MTEMVEISNKTAIRNMLQKLQMCLNKKYKTSAKKQKL